MRTPLWTLAGLLALAPLLPAHDEDDTCLLLIARNLAKGEGDFHLYHLLSEKAVEIRKGDRLRYDVFLMPSNPSPKGGVDVLFTNDTNVRDSGAVDAQGLTAHGNALLVAASGKWLTRTIDLTPHAGKTTKSFVAQFEGDETGDYVEFLDNVEIVHADGTKDVVYADGAPPKSKMYWRNGYSERVLCLPVLRARVRLGADLDALLADRRAKEELFHAKAELTKEVELVERFAKAEKRDDVADEAKKALEVPSPDEFQGTGAEYHELLHKQRGHLDHAHPLMRRYTGHLVGHAHIDLQWLWEWPEGLDFSRSTFEQACRFMEEYPEFTFTQSSAGLYEKIEEQYPQLFERIRKHVAEGRWEIAGGRWCEGDTNMISGESHARHLLYGQRYFQSRFGRLATVGWEPDTFGHTWQMPQILKLGGIDSYYFCRAGKGKPLFWWEGPDGSRVLAFDEPASGSWYNSDISDSSVEELLAFYEKTGLKDLIWVYGVGNHGGGPTREQIEKALSWKDKDGRPTVKFGTARRFFDLCKEKDLAKLPVVNEELNPVFRGCYTTHADVKRLNRDAEAALTTAEAVALVASRSGYPYPAEDLARDWKTVLWNHHHDTLPGSGIHDSYELTHVQLDHVIEQARWIQRSALRHLAYRVADEGAGEGIVVFNPLGWTRTAVADVKPAPVDGKIPRVVDGAGRTVASQWFDGTLSFAAAALPSFGYATYRVVWETPGADAATQKAAVAAPVTMHFADNAFTLENENLRVVIDHGTGELTSVVDKSAGGRGREVLTGGRRGNRIEAHMEDPHGMSAWQLGKIVAVEPVPADHAEPSAQGPVRAGVRVVRAFRTSSVSQEISLAAGARQVDFQTWIDWQAVGGEEKPAPLLRVAFPLGDVPPKGADGTAGAPAFEARYAIPFGDVARPADGDDVAGLEWGWILGPNGGGALLNDSKHGYSATADGELRLSLVRASYEPDPRPDVGLHPIGYALAPLAPGAKASAVTRLGFELNQPVLAQPMLHNKVNVFLGDRKGGVLPVTDSLVSFDGLDGAVATALKRSEDGNDLVVRMYQADPAAARGTLRCSAPLGAATETDFLEATLAKPSVTEGNVAVALRPYQIVTLRLTPK